MGPSYGSMAGRIQAAHAPMPCSVTCLAMSSLVSALKSLDLGFKILQMAFEHGGEV